MKHRFTLALQCTLLAAALYQVSAVAHDDGLTCHEHPKPDFSGWITLAGNFGVGDIDRVVHSFNNSIGEKPQVYVPKDVQKVRRTFSEIREATEIVARLVARADRSAISDKRQILTLSRDLYSVLKLGQFVSYDGIVRGVRTGRSVVLDFQNLRDYLTRELGVSDSVIIILDQAEQSCQ